MFISLEGGEGSGKTTTSQILAERLRAEGYDVVLTREPGGIDVAEKIRNIIFDYELDEKTEVLLFAAARIEHLEHIIKPAIAGGKIVICDRYIDSSIVYQGVARNQGIDAVRDLNYWATNKYLPDMTLFYDIEPEIALARINQDEREVNRFDKEKMEFHKNIYNAYKELAESTERIKTINANDTIDNVVETMYQLIKENIG